jgi:hypothetical protein
MTVIEGRSSDTSIQNISGWAFILALGGAATA